jgi:hypothetical protein
MTLDSYAWALSPEGAVDVANEPAATGWGVGCMSIFLKGVRYGYRAFYFV